MKELDFTKLDKRCPHKKVKFLDRLSVKIVINPHEEVTLWEHLPAEENERATNYHSK